MSTEKKPRPIVVEAFRFVHLKNPDIYSGKSFELDFISHPSPSSSAILQGQTEDFTPFASLQEVRAINPNLYSLVFWLKEHRGKFQKEDLAIQMESVGALKEDQRLTIWDNIFHQTQIDSSPVLVESLIRLLQADHFLQHYTTVHQASNETEEFDLGKLYLAAKASVVIPNQLFEQDQNVIQGSSMIMDVKSRTILADQLDIAYYQYHSQLHKKAVEELSAIEKGYLQDHQEAYQVAYQNYQDQVEELRQSAQDVTNEAGTIKICGETIAPFNFQAPTPLDENYLEANLSSNSLAIYQASKLDQHLYLADTKKAIEQSIGTLNWQKFRKIEKHRPKLLMHKGISLPLRNHPLNNTYVLKAMPIPGQNNAYNIYVTQYFENSITKIHHIAANVQTSDGEEYSTIANKPIHETEHYITFQLFPEGIVLEEADSTFGLTGSFKTEEEAYDSTFDYQGVRAEQLHTVQANTQQENYSIPTPNIYGMMGVKIAEFKKVNQTLCCYTEGEVSHIENILAREYKERETRNLTRSELTTDSITERESEKLSDTTSTERHEIQSEVSILMQENTTNNSSASASVGGYYNFTSGGINFNASGSLSTSSSSSSSSNFSESEAYAKELTQRAMQRLVEKTTYKRTAKMIKEFEETNKHGFDNREGEKHVTGVYRWVDKIYQNDLVNYGKRLMYEFTLPEPARNYKHLLTENLKRGQGEACDSVVLEKPSSPRDFGIHYYHQLDAQNFGSFTAYYGLDIEEYPVPSRTIAQSFSEDFYKTGSQVGAGKRLHCTQNFELELPTDYQCTGFTCKFVAKRHGELEKIFGDLLIGDTSKHFNGEYVQEVRAHSSLSGTININTGSQTIVIQPFTPVEDYLPIALAAEDVGVFALTVWAECELKEEAFNAFRLKMHTAMWDSYREMMQAYQDAQHDHCQNKVQQNTTSKDEEPNYNIPSASARAIEKREIKRLIIEQMMQKIYRHHYNFTGVTRPIGLNYYEQDAYNNTLNIATRPPFYKNQLRFSKFLEEAFEWEIMAYSFMPYYWADENEWGDLLSIDAAADHIFLAFLQSGMANIVLPVKPTLEKSVAFLLETGRLWRGTGFILEGQDDLYPAIEQQLQIEVDANGNEIKYDSKGVPIPVIEATWETRVPSTLTIVQNYSNPLDDEGLPCFCTTDKSTRIGYTPDKLDYNSLKGKVE